MSPGMADVVGVVGSGRRPSNSARLLEEALAGARQAGARTVGTFNLASLDFKGCVGCGTCRREAEACVLEDELAPVLQATANAQALVLATPIYYGYTTGLFKSYLDRWYAFRDAGRRLRMPGGRPALLIVTQGNPDPDAYAWAVGSLEKVIAAYGFRPRVLVAPGLEDAEAAGRSPALLARARDLGAQLAGR